MRIQPDIDLYTRRCPDCGRYWACEYQHTGDCPTCKNTRRNELFTETEQLKRTIVSLRGALTKAKAKP